MDLPAGFRFHPTDEELITNYLSNKDKDTSFTTRAIGEVDLNKCEPWDLPKRAKMGEKEWYFFCVKDKKYPTGQRTNRATDAGYWKATGKDKEIYRGKNLIGMKKTLVFYGGRAPRGEKTNWVMHEYRLEGRFSAYTHPKTGEKEWVICRLFQKNLGGKKVMGPLRTGSSFGSGLCSSALLSSMDMAYNSNNRVFSASDAHHVTCFSNAMEGESGHEELLAEYFNFPYLSAARNPSDSLVISKMPLSDSLLATQGEGMPYPGGSLVQLLESNGYGLKQSSKTESEMLGISQETELTTAMNTEICSVVSNNEVGRSFEGLEDPPTSAGPLHLDKCVWNY